MNGLQRAIKVAGGVVALSRKIGVSHQAISKWGGDVPPRRVIAIETATGVPREKLRPDLYPPRRRSK